jgi:hypothetical protein
MKILFPVLAFAALAVTGIPSLAAPTPPFVAPVLYHNVQYDFTFSLPASWRGYTVLSDQWDLEPYVPALDKDMVTEHGPIIILRHPLWKPGAPTQDIPIDVFTRRQWDQSDGEGVDACGLEYEIAHNSKYVFSVWSRFNTDASVQGWKEADTIVQRNIALNGPNLNSR